MRKEALPHAVGSIVRDLRIAHKKTQDQVASEAGLNRTYISLLELGQRDPKLSTLLQVLPAIEVTLTGFAMLLEKRLEEHGHDGS